MRDWGFGFRNRGFGFLLQGLRFRGYGVGARVRGTPYRRTPVAVAPAPSSQTCECNQVYEEHVLMRYDVRTHDKAATKELSCEKRIDIKHSRYKSVNSKAGRDLLEEFLGVFFVIETGDESDREDQREEVARGVRSASEHFLESHAHRLQRQPRP